VRSLQFVIHLPNDNAGENEPENGDASRVNEERQQQKTYKKKREARHSCPVDDGAIIHMPLA
jgi:hypothetical protein